MRYRRQGYELPVHHADPTGDPELLETLAQGFGAAHQRTYGFELDLEPELVIVRCVAVGVTPTPVALPALPGSSSEADAITDADHAAFWDGQWIKTPRYDRGLLEPGHEVPGPCVIEQEDSTTLVHPGTRVRVDELRNLLMERSAT